MDRLQLLETSVDFPPRQDGKPYIISNVARKVLNTSSHLSEGYTISSQSIFKSHEDHEFYDKECPAHKELKVSVGVLACNACRSGLVLCSC